MKNIIFKSFKLLVLFGLMSLSTQLFAQERMVKGTVTDASDNLGMPGVSIAVKGTTTGTSTDIDGNYSLTVPDDGVLIFSFVGYTSQEILVGDQTVINVMLEEETAALSEIVVTGYGIQKKKDVTGSIARVTEDDFNAGVITSPEQLIQGRVAGVQITNNSGEPGTGASINIRGYGSIRSNNDPLYVIDGVPLDLASSSPVGIQGVSGTNPNRASNPLSFLNADDIESIDILKDASAAAIYGSRGANGVVLITTKKGKKGEGTLSYSAYANFGKIREKLDVLSADEWRAARTANGLSGNDGGASTDWQDEIFRTAFSQNHNIAFSGGSEKTTFRASLSYLDQEGIVKKSGLERYTGRINTTHTTLNDRLKIDVNMTYSRVDQSRVAIGETTGAEGDIITNALQLNPTLPVYNADGTFFQQDGSNLNPVATIELIDDNTQTDRFLGNISATLDIIDGLKYKLNLGYDNTNAVRRIQISKEYFLNPEGRADINTKQLANSLVEHYLTYDKTIGDHNLSLLGGYSYQNFWNKGYEIHVADFPFSAIPFVNNVGMADNVLDPVSSVEKNELQSFFGRVNYSYKDKYLLTSTFRRDGSTRFGGDNHYGNFPSVALGWRISEEDFIKNLDIFHNLKLRAGWGKVGNQEFINKVSQASLAPGAANKYYIDGTNPSAGLAFKRTPNEKIKWEETTQVNVGLDFAILKGKLSGSIEYFNKNTTNMLLLIGSLPPAPVPDVWTNLDGELVNKGFELALSGVIYDTKDFKWNVDFNFSTIDNEISGLAEGFEIQTGTASGQGLSNTYSQLITNGQSMGTFYGKKFTGIDASGKATYFDEDGDENPDNFFLGTALPDYTFSVNNTFKYKNFDLNVFVDAVQGNKVFNNTALSIFNKMSLGNAKNTTQKAVDSGRALDDALSFSSEAIEDGSFIRLSNVTLGYTFDVSKTKWLSSARVYVTGTNLLLITDYSGYDPEINTDANKDGVPSIGVDNTSYPRPRTLQIGVNLNF